MNNLLKKVSFCSLLILITFTLSSFYDGEFPKYLPHETSCSDFYIIFENGEKVRLQCPPGLHYNAEKSICEWPQDANCILSETNPTPGNGYSTVERDCYLTCKEAKNLITSKTYKSSGAFGVTVKTTVCEKGGTKGCSSNYGCTEYMCIPQTHTYD